MKSGRLQSAILLSWLSCAVVADDVSIKPGLWEIQLKNSVDGQQMPDMNEMLAQVPPEMRGQVQAMMAKQGAGMTEKGVKVCISPEQAANQQYGNDPDSQCQVAEKQQDGNVLRMKIRCSKPQGEGETTVIRESAESWHSTTHMTVEENGAAHTVSSESKAHWLGADCVAPAQATAASDKKTGKHENRKSAP